MPDTRAVRLAGAPEALDLDVPTTFASFFKLSPYVTRAAAGYDMLVRLVNDDANPANKVSRVHAGHGRDGRAFTIGATPVIAPGPAGADDDRGCEDPTTVTQTDRVTVFYSGYGGARERSTMLVASGAAAHQLVKAGLAFDDPAFTNPKEAAFIATPEGWTMFFEYATHGASRIGVARAAALGGPWTLSASLLPERPNSFDAWHLSPACAVRLTDGTNILFYNGSTKATAWRIAWARISEDARVVLERADEPLIGTFDLEPGDTDIAFASSCVVEAPGTVSLYYSVSDRKLFRQRLFVEGAVRESANDGCATLQGGSS